MKISKFTLLIFCITTTIVDVVFGFSGCHHKNFGQESTVCVCNEGYCDSLDPVTRTEPGVVQVYSTTRSGNPPDRFAHYDIRFNNSNSNDGIEIQIDTNNKMQKIVGFGGALTDTTGYNFKRLPESLQRNLIRDYFGTEGIEYSACRVTIGGSDMSTRSYSDDDHNGDDFDLNNFRLQTEDLELKIPFLQMAQKITPHHPLKIFGTAWSPPAWMKTNNDLSHGGHLKGDANGPYYKAYAKYLVKFMKEYQQNHNVSYWGMTIVNEPGSFGYNSLEMSAEEQREFIKKNLGPTLEQNGFNNFQVMIWDWNIPNMKWFVQTILSDPDAAKYAPGIAFHWYATSDSNRGDLKQIHDQFPNHFILSTEACEGFGGDSLGVWHTAENYAKDIIKNLKNYVTGWVDWNMVVDMHGGPSWVNQHLNAPVIVNADAREYYKQPAFYALGHFSKFFPPGSQHIHYTSNSNHPDYDMIAFLRPDDGVAMVILNHGEQPKTFSINDPKRGKVRVDSPAHSFLSIVWY